MRGFLNFDLHFRFIFQRATLHLRAIRDLVNKLIPFSKMEDLMMFLGLDEICCLLHINPADNLCPHISGFDQSLRLEHFCLSKRPISKLCAALAFVFLSFPNPSTVPFTEAGEIEFVIILI